MSDVLPSNVHLPINIWIANAELVHEDFVTNGSTYDKPRIQNIKDIQEHGYALGDYLDDETIEFNETKEQIDVPVLSPTGVQTQNLYQLLNATEITIPIQSFTYALQAILHGLDFDSDVINDADVRFDNDGYTDGGADSQTANPTYDKVGTLVDRVESITTLSYCLLAQVDPPDPSLGDKYILAPKLKINKEEVQNMMASEYHQDTIDLRSILMTDAELTRWQNIVPKIKKSIGFYTFHIKTPAS